MVDSKTLKRGITYQLLASLKQAELMKSGCLLSSYSNEPLSQYNSRKFIFVVFSLLQLAHDP